MADGCVALDPGPVLPSRRPSRAGVGGPAARSRAQRPHLVPVEFDAVDGGVADPAGSDAAAVDAAADIPPPPPGGRARERDRDDQLAVLFEEHYTGLCRLAWLILGDRGAAEEAVSEAFLRTYTGFFRIRRPERAQWYLRRAVVNQCRSRQRRLVTEDRGNRVVQGGDDGRSRATDPAGAPEALAVLAAVHALPPRQRAAVVLRYYEDLSEAEIASTLGCSAGTVKSQLSKARATLALALAETDPAAPPAPVPPAAPRDAASGVPAAVEHPGTGEDR